MAKKTTLVICLNKAFMKKRVSMQKGKKDVFGCVHLNPQ